MYKNLSAMKFMVGTIFITGRRVIKTTKTAYETIGIFFRKNTAAASANSMNIIEYIALTDTNELI